MKKPLISCMLLFISTLIIGCSPKPVCNPNLPQCQLICKQRYAQCNAQCEDSTRICAIKACKKASKDIRCYAHQKQITGGTIYRELNSYRDPLQCRKTTCDCETDYNVCRQSCSGVIPKVLGPATSCNIFY